MQCQYCRSLLIRIEPAIILHQVTCQDTPATNKLEDADHLRLKLNGVVIGMWADTVLSIHPEAQTRKPEVIGVDTVGEDGSPNYVVKWFYPGFTLIMERAAREHQEYGIISMYAVQRIEHNEERKPVTRKKSRHKLQGRGNKGGRNIKHRRGNLK